MKIILSIFSGIKSNYETSGVDGSVHLNDCKASLNKSHHVESILKWAQDANMATGFVTTTRYIEIQIFFQSIPTCVKRAFPQLISVWFMQHHQHCMHIYPIGNGNANRK